MDTKATAPASIWVKDKRLLPSMYEKLEAADEGKPGLLLSWNVPQDEDVVRANGDAWTLCFATHRVDNRDHGTRRKSAIRIRLH